MSQTHFFLIPGLRSIDESERAAADAECLRRFDCWWAMQGGGAAPPDDIARLRARLPLRTTGACVAPKPCTCQACCGRGAARCCDCGQEHTTLCYLFPDGRFVLVDDRSCSRFGCNVLVI